MKPWLSTTALAALALLASACSDGSMTDEGTATTTVGRSAPGTASTQDTSATLGTQTAMAQPAPQSMGSTAGLPAPESDAMFAQDAARGDATEIEMAQLTLQRASSPAVREFAQHMIDDHTQSSAKLAAIAATGKVTLAAAPGATGQDMLQKLSTLQGLEFDRAYMRVQVAAHQQMAQLMQWEMQNGTDVRLKAFAGAVLPTVQSHLQMAQQIASTL
jgi:putative membrane protein